MKQDIKSLQNKSKKRFVSLHRNFSYASFRDRQLVLHVVPDDASLKLITPQRSGGFSEREEKLTGSTVSAGSSFSHTSPFQVSKP